MAEPGRQETSGRSGLDLWAAAARGLTVLVVAAMLGLLTYETLHPVIAVEPIPSTRAMTDLGLTPEVAAQHLRDGLATIAAGADGVNRPNLSLSMQKPDMTLPGVGISIEAVATYLRSVLHIDTVREVSGDFTEGNGHVWLRVRVDGVLVYQSPPGGVDPAHASQELDLGARMVAREITPYLYAAYLHHIHDPSETDTLRAIVTERRAGATDIAAAERLWGQIAAEKFDGGTAMAHYMTAGRLYQATGSTKELASLQNYIGQVHYQTGAFDQARGAYQLAIDGDPSRETAAIAWLNIGDIRRYHDNDATGALAAYQNALAIDPHLRFAHDAEGRVQEALGRYEHAADSYRKSIDDYPGDEQSYVHLAQLIAEHPDAFTDPQALLHRVSVMASQVEVTCVGAP